MNNILGEIPGGDYNFLRRNKQQIPTTACKTIRLVDLFCGCGGISLGVKEACNTMGYNLEIPLAVDFEKEAADCYERNFPHSGVRNCDITTLFSSELGADLLPSEVELRNLVGELDILVGGPPCQGHSDLNHYTKRNDPKNRLYLYMARAAEVFKPKHIIIENVVGALHDKGQVVQLVEDYLSKLGYNVSKAFVNMTRIGVPQARKRLVLLATKLSNVDVNSIESKYPASSIRTVEWAIKDLVDMETNDIYNQPAVSSKDNRARIEYLFNHDIYDLPNSERPPCHKDKEHSYNSIYGRLHWEKPSQTITSGFYSMCMGRYVHPEQHRTLTAHEAARLQFFPDYFDFSTVKSRTSLSKIIGNAVPMKLPYLVCLELFIQERERDNEKE